MTFKTFIITVMVIASSFIAARAVVEAQELTKQKIVLIAGEITKVDTVGHHDYLAGCECLRVLLQQIIHQAVDFPDQFADLGKTWLGGIYQKDKSGRGHWPSSHIDFPQHPITNGVKPWQINDGWLNGIQFVGDMQGITPLVWSGKEVEESRAGLDNHIVAWSYDRPAGGRSFSFSGLDAHSAWELPGMRQLVVNGILWSANMSIPEGGTACSIHQKDLAAILTPRTSKAPAKKNP